MKPIERVHIDPEDIIQFFQGIDRFAHLMSPNDREQVQSLVDTINNWKDENAPIHNGVLLLAAASILASKWEGLLKYKQDREVDANIV